MAVQSWRKREERKREGKGKECCWEEWRTEEERAEKGGRKREGMLPGTKENKKIVEEISLRGKGKEDKRRKRNKKGGWEVRQNHKEKDSRMKRTMEKGI